MRHGTGEAGRREARQPSGSGQAVRQRGKTGISFGSALAMLISCAPRHGVGCAIVRGLGG